MGYYIAVEGDKRLKVDQKVIAILRQARNQGISEVHFENPIDKETKKHLLSFGFSVTEAFDQNVKKNITIVIFPK